MRSSKLASRYGRLGNCEEPEVRAGLLLRKRKHPASTSSSTGWALSKFDREGLFGTVIERCFVYHGLVGGLPGGNTQIAGEDGECLHFKHDPLPAYQQNDSR